MKRAQRKLHDDARTACGADPVRELLRRRAAQLLLALGPVFALALALKLVRIVLHPAELAGWEGALLLLPDLLVQAGLLALGAALLELPRRRLTVLAVLVAFQALAVAYGLATVTAHGYFLATRSVLDWSQFAFAAAMPAVDMLPMLASQVSGPSGTLIGIATVGILLLPWVAPHLLGRGLDAAEGAGSGRGSARGRAGSVVGFGAAVALCGLSFVPNIVRVDRAFARDSFAHLVRGALGPGIDGAAAQEPFSERPGGPAAIVQAGDRARRNLVFIILESTRATATTAYVPTLATTPNLASLARDSLTADRAYAVIPHTSKAMVALLCGLEPSPSLAVVENRDGGIGGRCLADLLGDHAYRSAFFMSAFKAFERFETIVRNMGFRDFFSGDEMDQAGLEMSNYFGFEDEILLGPSRRWLEAHANEPMIVAYLTNAPHHDYRKLSRFDAVDYVEAEAENRYLNNVRYLDYVVGALIDQYRDLGIYDDTVFVVVGDHGEAFGEHGLWTHDDVVYEEGLRVPLLIHAPGIAGTAGRIANPVSQLDLAPTVLEMLGFEFDPSVYPGRSMLREPTDRTLHAACFRNNQCLAGVRGDEKFIFYYGSRPPELYDLASDPGESINLAPRRPEDVARWQSETTAWRRAVHGRYRNLNVDLVAKYVQPYQPTPRQPRFARYGELLELVGADLPADGAVRERSFDLTVHYRALGPVPEGHRLLLRARTASHEQVFDHVPVRGLYPLPSWESGKYVRDIQRIAIPAHWDDPWVDLCIELRHAERGAVAARVSRGASEDCVSIGRLALTGGA